MRPPENVSWSILSPPNRTAVPGWPRIPADEAGPVVTSGGSLLSLIHHKRSSALTQKRPGGPHGSTRGKQGEQHSPQGAVPQQAVPQGSATAGGVAMTEEAGAGAGPVTGPLTTPASPRTC